MASKKGIIMTMVVLGVITAASFLVWTLPQSATISVSDYGEYLDRAQQINQVVVDGIDNNFQMLTSGELDVDEYVDTAKTSSTQLRSELIQMMQVGVPAMGAISRISVPFEKGNCGYDRDCQANYKR